MCFGVFLSCFFYFKIPFKWANKCGKYVKLIKHGYRNTYIQVSKIKLHCSRKATATMLCYIKQDLNVGNFYLTYTILLILGRFIVSHNLSGGVTASRTATTCMHHVTNVNN